MQETNIIDNGISKSLQAKIDDCYNKNRGAICLPQLSQKGISTGNVTISDPAQFCNVGGVFKYGLFSGKVWWKSLLYIILASGIFWFIGIFIGALLLMGIDDPDGTIAMTVGSIIGIALEVGFMFLIAWMRSCGKGQKEKFLGDIIGVNRYGSSAKVAAPVWNGTSYPQFQAKQIETQPTEVPPMAQKTKRYRLN